MNIATVIMATVVFCLMVAVYFFPFIVALLRKKQNAPAIFVLNCFLGYTGIGWIVALIWSLMRDQ